MRICPAPARLATADLRIQVPASNKMLRAALPAGSRESLQILRPIDVQPDARQFEDNRWQSGCIRGRTMRQKTVISETQREEVARSTERGVSSASGRVWD